MRIDVFSDTVCPWCYLGKRRFELALARRPQYSPRVTWRPFEINPDLPWEGKAKEPAPPSQSEVALAEQGATVGIDFRFDLIERIPNSRRSHLLIAHAARRGLAAQVTDRLMRAYFEEGCDIGNIDELVRLGTQTGLPAFAARAAMVLREGQDGVVAAERHASVLGITGVPNFIFDGRFTVPGAQEIEVMARILDQVADAAATRGVS